MKVGERVRGRPGAESALGLVGRRRGVVVVLGLAAAPAAPPRAAAYAMPNESKDDRTGLEEWAKGRPPPPPSSCPSPLIIVPLALSRGVVARLNTSDGDNGSAVVMGGGGDRERGSG